MYNKTFCWILVAMIAAVVVVGFGCRKKPGAIEAVTSGSADTVRFSVASSTNPDPAAAGAEAVNAAVSGLGCPAKAVVFYAYYQDPNFVPDEESQATAVKQDPAAEEEIVKSVAQACGDIPNVGCRARSLTNKGTLLKDAVTVLAIGGEQASVAVKAVEISDDRRSCGVELGQAMKDVNDLELILALAEMRLSFEAKEGVSVEGFIRGVVDTVGQDVMLLGGNSMPDDMAGDDLDGAQYINGQVLKGHIVALGLGGPLDSVGTHTNEFVQSDQTLTVTENRDKWVVSFNDKPAMGVYRDLRGMEPEEELSSDWQHPIGVIVGEDKVYVRMILDWITEDGTNMKGEESELPPGSLKFVSPVVEGTRVKVLKGGDNAQAIVDAAREGTEALLAKAKQAGIKPVLHILSDCCARGMRLRTFRTGDADEVTDAIIPAMDEEIPLLGFYAWGELGPIAGEYQGLTYQYQQHTFVSGMVGIKSDN